MKRGFDGVGVKTENTIGARIEGRKAVEVVSTRSMAWIDAKMTVAGIQLDGAKILRRLARTSWLCTVRPFLVSAFFLVRLTERHHSDACLVGLAHP